MTYLRKLPIILCAMSLVSASIMSTSLTAQTSSRPALAQKWLEKIKSLKGDWTAPESDEIVVNYKIVAGGSAVMETDFPGQPHEMISMYFLDGNNLMMQHYCMLENQPRFKARLAADGNKLEFKFVGGTNIDVDKDAHIHNGIFTFESKNRLQTEWLAYSKGNPSDTHAFDLVRKPTSTHTKNSKFKGKKK